MNQINIARRNNAYNKVLLGQGTITWHDKKTGELTWARAVCPDGKRRLVKSLKSKRLPNTSGPASSHSMVTECVCRIQGKNVYGYLELKRGNFDANTVHFMEF